MDETATIAALQQRVSELETVLENSKQQTERLHVILDTMTTDWAWEVDANAVYTYVSPNIVNILGYTPQEIVGKIPFDLMPPEEVGRVAGIFGPIVEARKPIKPLIENTLLHKDGHHLVMETGGAPFYHQDGTFAGYRGIDRDITERKQSETERDQFFQISPELISIAGFDGYFKSLNPSWSRVLGWNNDELYAEPFLSFVHPDDVQPTIDAAQQIEGGKTIISFTNRYRCKDGSYLWFEWIARPVAEEQRIYGVARDITARKQAESEAERSAFQQQVIEAQQSALRELSTPLIPITDNVVIMPLIGTIDSQRAQQIMESLLEGVAQHQSTLAILDITGVQVVDTQVANAFIQAAQAVRLLGTQVMLTGIQPQVAQTLVQLGVDLSDIITKGSLQAGIAAALRDNT